MQKGVCEQMVANLPTQTDLELAQHICLLYYTHTHAHTHTLWQNYDYDVVMSLIDGFKDMFEYILAACETNDRG